MPADGFSKFSISNGCLVIGVFAANCIRLDVSLDTIPSVLGEHKPLQVVRCVKNKYLLSHLFLTGLGSANDPFLMYQRQAKRAIDKHKSCAL
jgi:hypothetical protein